MDPLRTEDRDAWRRWLAKNHKSTEEIWLLLYKKGAKKPSVSYDEAVEEALCYGWIDSMIRRVDEESYVQKFSRRKKGSKWSASNIARMEKLIERGKVAEPGLMHYLSRDRQKPETSAVPRRGTEIPSDVEIALKTSNLAWKNFEDFPAYHRDQYILWITSAKKPETRKKRVSEAVKMIEKSVKHR